MTLQLAKILVFISCHVLFLPARSSLAAEFIPIVDPRTASSGFAAHPDAVSDNGVVVGGSTLPGNNSPGEPFRWNQDEGFQYLGVPFPDMAARTALAYGISADGTSLIGIQVVAGRVPFFFHWEEELGYADITALGMPRYISDDSNFLAASDEEGVVLRGPDGALRLGELEGETVTTVNHMSADASVIVGADWYWTQSAGVQALPAPDAAEGVWVEAVSADGGTIVGWSDANDGRRSAVAWKSDDEGRFESPPTELLPFDSQVTDDVWTEAFLVSSDGSLVFGRIRESPPSCPACATVVWVDGQEPVAFTDWLADEHDLGEQIAGWDFDSFMPFVQTIQSFGDISSNNRYLIGQALNPAGERSAFMIDFGAPVPEPSALAMLVLGCLCCSGINRRR